MNFWVIQNKRNESDFLSLETNKLIDWTKNVHKAISFKRECDVFCFIDIFGLTDCKPFEIGN